MARLLADENFPLPTVKRLRELGHDVRTLQEIGQSGALDESVLQTAIADARAVVTHNRRHFVKLHIDFPEHLGIVICTEDEDFEALGERIHELICLETSLAEKLIRVRRPSR